jgi:hypothetical protein
LGSSESGIVRCRDEKTVDARHGKDPQVKVGDLVYVCVLAEERETGL